MDYVWDNFLQTGECGPRTKVTFINKNRYKCQSPYYIPHPSNRDPLTRYNLHLIRPHRLHTIRKRKRHIPHHKLPHILIEIISIATPLTPPSISPLVPSLPYVQTQTHLKLQTPANTTQRLCHHLIEHPQHPVRLLLRYARFLDEAVKAVDQGFTDAITVLVMFWEE